MSGITPLSIILLRYNKVLGKSKIALSPSVASLRKKYGTEMDEQTLFETNIAASMAPYSEGMVEGQDYCHPQEPNSEKRFFDTRNIVCYLYPFKMDLPEDGVGRVIVLRRSDLLAKSCDWAR